MQPLPQDTPTHRATIKEMSIEQIEALVESMRERRMRSYNAYEIAKAAKEKIKQEKDKARYEKVLEMLEKKVAVAEKAMDACTKYLNELKVMELVLGE
jgi:hypothetical protein